MGTLQEQSNGPGAGCVILKVMPGDGTSRPIAQRGARGNALALGVDTCGPSGSVALGRMGALGLEVLGQTELEGRSYSATLVAAVGELLERFGVRIADVSAMVAVNGPGSFTGVRVGLSAVKGLAEAAEIPIVAVSRLEVLAAKAGVAAAALDAHRLEIFLRVGAGDLEPTEMLAGAAELTAMGKPLERIAVCDDAAAGILCAAWPGVQMIRVDAPTAADALALAGPRWAAGEFVDALVLDGNYLRRSDAEIFGNVTEGEAVRRP